LAEVGGAGGVGFAVLQMCDLAEVGGAGGVGFAVLQMCDLAEVGEQGQLLSISPLILPVPHSRRRADRARK
ncbi:MAG: hypothetical protein NWR72_18765, partial [Bacteroidia bacterium]|nr:hypothetical protein [Bacteroidia bacterium]